MDNFFYDLNKKLDGIRAKPEAGQLNEDYSPINEKGEKWIQKAVNPAHKGDLHKALHVPQGEKIPAGKLAKATHSSNPTLKKQAVLAKTLRGLKKEDMTDEGNAFGKAVRDAKADGIQPGEKIKVGGETYPVKEEGMSRAAKGMMKYGKEGMKALAKAGREGRDLDKVRNKYDKYDESAMYEADPMGLEEKLSAPQLKKFAKLAPPRNKVTFADKIAGAKKEVDEMLGDVAADAMRSAVGNIKKKHSGEMDESWDDMMKDVKHRAHSTSGMKTGERKRSSTGGEIEKTATGLRHHAKSHDHDDDDKKSDDAPRGRGRPKGPEKKAERVTGKAWKHKGGRKVKEGEDDLEDRGEYDREGDMVKDNLHTIRREATRLEKILGDNENLPEWVEDKLAQVKGMIMSASEYMQTQHERDVEDETGEEGITMGERAVSKAQRRAAGIAHAAQKGEIPQSKLRGASKEMAKMAKGELHKFAATKEKGLPKHVEEEGTDKRDQHAEKAGRKVTKDLEYDMGHKGKDDNKAERAGRKVTKDIEYDEKHKKVKETTSSGSVATASTNGKAKTGGMSFGKGVYEGINSQVERMITEGMNVSVNMTQGDDGQPHKSITVSAEGEEAENLTQLLRLAGMHKQPEESCPTCGSAPCGCDENVAENAPDWPTNPESSPNAMQYSGGLNGPKSTGQTTTPVIAGQRQRMSTMEENVELERSLFKTWKNYKG